MDSLDKIIEEMRGYKRSAWTPTLARVDEWASRLSALQGEVNDLTKLARQSHYSCEDPWYSCPKSVDGCTNEFTGDECTCGADKHNAMVDAIASKIYAAPPQADGANEPAAKTREEL